MLLSRASVDLDVDDKLDCDCCAPTLAAIVLAKSRGVKGLARRAIIASVKRGLRMVPPASAEPTLGVIAASAATGWPVAAVPSAAAVGPTMSGPST